MRWGDEEEENGDGLGGWGWRDMEMMDGWIMEHCTIVNISYSTMSSIDTNYYTS